MKFVGLWTVHGCTVHKKGQKLRLLFMYRTWTVTACGEKTREKKKEKKKGRGKHRSKMQTPIQTLPQLQKGTGILNSKIIYFKNIVKILL